MRNAERAATLWKMRRRDASVRVGASGWRGRAELGGIGKRQDRALALRSFLCTDHASGGVDHGRQAELGETVEERREE